jgi:hypothetical protein
MVYGTQITVVTGAYKPTYNWGASHCVDKGFKIVGFLSKGIPLLSSGKTINRDCVLHGWLNEEILKSPAESESAFCHFKIALHCFFLGGGKSIFKQPPKTWSNLRYPAQK